MDIGMYQSAAALNAYEQWQNNVAHNLSNVSTAGYKKQAIALHKDPIGSIPMEQFSPFERMLIGSSPEAMSQTSFEQGRLQKTGNHTDLAIEGEGFFEVELPDGGLMYSRGGQFQLNHEGVLVTGEGYPVRDASGGQIVLQAEDEEAKEQFYVNRNGEIFRGNDQVGAIGVKMVENKSALHHREGGFVLTGDSSVRDAQPDEYSVYQGFIEGSNSSAMNEMIQMINLSRSFESNTRIIQAFDSRYGETIAKLGTT